MNLQKKSNLIVNIALLTAVLLLIFGEYKEAILVFIITIIEKYNVNVETKKNNEVAENAKKIINSRESKLKKVEIEISKIETAIEFLNSLTKEEEEKYLQFKM